MTLLQRTGRGRAAAFIAVMAAGLAGCADAPDNWRAGTVPLVTAPAEAASARRAPCPAVDPAITAEARRVTPIAGAPELDALTAALIGSEAAKNASLARLARAYEKCRRGAHSEREGTHGHVERHGAECGARPQQRGAGKQH